MTTSTQSLIFPIVGAHYRAPALTILKHLALNTSLLLHAEPFNTYDPNAISVWVHIDNIPLEKLPHATTIVYNKSGEFQLGYIPAVDAINIRFDRTKTIEGIFLLDDRGKPQVKMTKFKPE